MNRVIVSDAEIREGMRNTPFQKEYKKPEQKGFFVWQTIGKQEATKAYLKFPINGNRK